MNLQNQNMYAKGGAPMQQNPQMGQMSEEEMMMQEQAGMDEDMNARLMAVVGVLATALDKYIDVKVDYLSTANKLAELKGEEGEDTSEVLAKCMAWKDSMMAQVMQLLGAEFEDPSMGQGMMQGQDVDGDYE